MKMMKTAYQKMVDCVAKMDVDAIKITINAIQSRYDYNAFEVIFTSDYPSGKPIEMDDWFDYLKCELHHRQCV
jgi:hypothetical protein